MLIIGKIPPPIGGVTMHTKRLLEYLRSRNEQYSFYNLNNFKLNTFIHSIYSSKIAHIHTTNASLLFIFVMLSKLLNTYSILTIHGNLSAYKFPYKYIVILSIKFVNLPVLLNEKSSEIARKYNDKSMIISAFIPQQFAESLDEDMISNIYKLKQRHKKIFCTNAYDFVFDKNNNEVYGILQLIGIFKKMNHLGLIISDPMGSYTKYFYDHNITISKNVLILKGSHSFVEVIKQSDSLIRLTSKDGDSLSVKEAIWEDIPVIASDCVDRPNQVILCKYGDSESIIDSIEKVLNQNYRSSENIANGADILLSLYNKIAEETK